jgi:hypothetical protein
MVRTDPKLQRGHSTQWTDSAGKEQLDPKDNITQTTLRKLTVAWPLVIFLLLPALTRAETAVQAWVQRYSGPGNFNMPYAVVADGSNNVIVTGSSASTNVNPAVYDYATIKYSSAGVALWTNRYRGYNSTGNSGDNAFAMAVDGSNNVVVTGSSYGGVSGYDYATIKYSSAGVPLWTNRYNGPGNSTDSAFAMAVDGSNNVIVTGNSTGSGSSYDYTTIEYSSAGVPLWTNRYGGSGNYYDTAQAVAVDGSNNVIVTGYSDGGMSGYDYATIKYSSAGVPLWTNRYNGPGNGDDEAKAVAVDGSNNVIVTGYSTGSGGYYDTDYTTIKYSSAGVPLWTNRYSGPANGGGAANAVAVDSSNDIIVTGSSAGSGSSAYATIKYSSAGVPLWTNHYIGPGDSTDDAFAVAVDRSGNVIVTGQAGGGGHFDYATIKYICVPSPVISNLSLTNGTFQMRVDEVLQPGTLVIEASTNLAGWAPVFTNTATTNVLFYTDPDTRNHLGRFYRVFQFP